MKDLSIILSSDLSWGSHISTIASRARKVAAWVLSAFKTRNMLTMMTLYKSLVRSHLEYCCPLWNSCKTSETQEIEGVQWTFTARIWGFQHLNYWQRLKALDLMSLQRRRERYIIIHMWKILHYKCPNNINIQFCAPSNLAPKLSFQESRNQVVSAIRQDMMHRLRSRVHGCGISSPAICILLTAC